jgi:hypothetical protein
MDEVQYDWIDLFLRLFNDTVSSTKKEAGLIVPE